MAAGRPAHFENGDQLRSKVEEYYTYLSGDYVDVKLSDDEGNSFTERKYTRHPEDPTITGLALFLGFESRQSVYDYEKNGEFSYIIKNARLRVEHGYEKSLKSDKPTGAIFALKNMGWTDKMELDNNVNLNGSVSPDKWLQSNNEEK